MGGRGVGGWGGGGGRSEMLQMLPVPMMELNGDVPETLRFENELRRAWRELNKKKRKQEEKKVEDPDHDFSLSQFGLRPRAT